MGYISGVHFERCSNFSIKMFTLKLCTQNFSSSKEGGQAQLRKGPPNTPLRATMMCVTSAWNSLHHVTIRVS